MATAGGATREYPVDVDKLPGPTELALRSIGTSQRFKSFVEGTLLGEIREACASGMTTIVLFDLEAKLAHVPWELAFDLLIHETSRAAFTPVRSFGSPMPWEPWKIGKRMRVLILFGHPGEPPNVIDPEREAADIVKTWANLESAARDRIEQPRVEPLDPSALSRLVADFRPHIIWYSGHGRGGRHAGLLYGPRRWLSASQFAAAISARASPLFCVFWACELGEATPEQVVPAPELHRELVLRGVRATLAAQSRIADDVAREMALQLFRWLAAGLSLERAAARARAHACRLPHARLDWAAPAVWLSRHPVGAILWNEKPADPLIQRLLARSSVDLALKAPVVGAEPVDPSAAALAARWRQLGRVLVRANPSDEATLITLARAADAAARESGLVPVFVTMRSASPRAAIADWAAEMRAWCEPQALPTALGRAVAIGKYDQPAALRHLLDFDGALLVFICPLLDTEADWFLGAIVRSPRSGPVVLVTPEGPSDQRFDTWRRDAVMTEIDFHTLEPHLSLRPQPLQTLAVLDMPLPDATLALAGFSRDVFPRGTPFLVETRFGPVIAATAKHFILEQMSEQDLHRAHEVCLRLLDPGATGWAEGLLAERLRHLVGAGHIEEALSLAAELIERLDRDGRPAAVTTCAERLQPLGARRDDLDPATLLRIALAYIRLGKLRHARLRLERCHPVDDLQSALKCALESEVHKSDGAAGSRERAIALMQQAIALCRKAGEDPERTRAAELDRADYQMNLARLLHYLEYRLEEAEEAYREIIREWGSTPGSELLIAAAMRNLAECVVSQALPSGVSALQEAEQLLAEANARLRTTPEDPLRAEIAYEEAKLAERRGDEPAAIHLLKNCITLARETGNGLVSAIAEARLFWLRDPFDPDRWHALQQNLTPYRYHGWAVRTAMRGRIRAARHLEIAGRLPDALELLRRNLADLTDRPGYDRGTDRLRAAATLAGLATLSSDEPERQDAQERFAALPWGSAWLRERGFNRLEDLWPEVN